MDHVQIWADMDRLTAMMVEKGIVTPKAELWIRSGETVQLNLWGRNIDDRGGALKVFYTGIPAELIEIAAAYIAALPSTADRNQQAFQAKLAELIDFGNAEGIEVQFLNPLIETARSLASNALTAEMA